MKKLHIVRKIGNPKYLMLMLGIALVVFDLNYYLMSTMPGSRDQMCVMGVNLTPGNIAFSVVLSLLTGMLVAGLIALFAKRAAQRKAAMASLSGVGLGVGLLTFFCPVCSLPLFSIAGAGVIFQAFNDYNLIFKVVSVLFLVGAILLLNSQLSDDCKKCVFEPEKAAK
jgi:hypothetical protein